MNRLLRQFRLEDFIAQRVTRRAKSLFQPDWNAHQANLKSGIEGKSVLVIGGAGTIGSAFIKCLLPFQPERLCVVDVNENGLAELVRDLRSTNGVALPKVFKTSPFDFGDRVFEKFFRQEGPFEIVANFAAHKHVRSEKDLYSIEAMIRNNVFKNRQLLDLLCAFPPERFFCVSTDKATEPANVMGATKRLMEQVLLAYADKIQLSTARFANVAFSNGSLPAAFLERLMKRQPLSAPNDVARYFVSPREAGELCLLACLLGESGDIFFPKLNPEKDTPGFHQIALSLLEALGLEPDFCNSEDEAKEKSAKLNDNSTHWPVYFFASDTSGEKKQETFWVESDRPDMDRFDSMGVIKPASKPELSEIRDHLNLLEGFFNQQNGSKTGLLELMCRFVPDFRHIETGKNLDDKM